MTFQKRKKEIHNLDFEKIAMKRLGGSKNKQKTCIKLNIQKNRRILQNFLIKLSSMYYENFT